MKKPRSPKWEVAKTMPPLKHSLPGKEYDVTNSQAVDWLIHQPEIMQLVFDSVRDHGDIVFDPDTKSWRGVKYGH